MNKLLNAFTFVVFSFVVNLMASEQVVVAPPPHPIPKVKLTPIDKIKKRGKLIVAVYNKYKPPFALAVENDENDLRGLDADFARRIAEKIGVEVEFNFSPTSYNDVVDTVASGKADIGISKLSFTYARASKALFAKTYSKLNKSIIVNRILMAKAKSERGAKTLRDVLNHPSAKIGMIRASSYVNFTKELFPKATIVEIDAKDWKKVAKKALEIPDGSGKINAIFRDNLEIQKVLTFSPKSNLYVAPFDLKGETDFIRMVVGKDAHLLLQIVNEVIDTSLDLKYDVSGLLKAYADLLE